MIKYTNLRAVLNMVPAYIKEQEDETQMLSWAFQAYRETVKQSLITDNYKVAIIQAVDHKCTLPQGMKKIIEVGWADTNPVLDDSSNVFFPTVVNNVHILLAEAIYYQQIKHRTNNMRYVGQNPELLDNSCINIFCPTCSIEFSVNKSMTQLTTSERSGYIALVYSCVAKEGDDFIVPDNVELLQGMAKFISSKHWEDRMGRKEEGAYNMYVQETQMASNYLGQFIKSRMLASFSANEFKNAILSTFTHLKNQNSAVNHKALTR